MRRNFGFVWNYFGGPILYHAWFVHKVEEGRNGVGAHRYYVVLPQP